MTHIMAAFLFLGDQDTNIHNSDILHNMAQHGNLAFSGKGLIDFLLKVH